ncbi:MAG: DUF423 domain-containing protein [Nitratireductor sp.]|nr:DUF423 domain-containing protein [Nitratireductor sp.]
MKRFFALYAGLLGAAGIALAAAASHGGSSELSAPAALVALTTAAAMLAVVGPGGGRMADGIAARMALAALVAWTLGSALFCASLGHLAMTGERLLPYSAPTGGMLLMAGWALAGLALACKSGRR